MSERKKPHQQRLDTLFVAIGRLEERARRLKYDVRDDKARDAVGRTQAHLEAAWRELSDAGLVRHLEAAWRELSDAGLVQ
jgi:hypothetical protein